MADDAILHSHHNHSHHNQEGIISYGSPHASPLAWPEISHSLQSLITQNVVHRPAASASPGMSKIQNCKPHPDLLNLILHFNKIPRDSNTLQSLQSTGLQQRDDFPFLCLKEGLHLKIMYSVRHQAEPTWDSSFISRDMKLKFYCCLMLLT